MTAADPGALLREGAVLLGSGLAFVLLFRRLGLGATLGYLVAGAAVGPEGLALVDGAEGKMGIAELGITLLLFIVGLELNPARLWRMRGEILGIGLVQVTLCGLAIAGILYLAGFSVAAAIALGLPLGLSSTAQVLPMLQSAGRLRTPFGERAFSILLFQDLSIVPLITIVAALSRNPAADAHAPPGWLLAVYTVAAVAGLIVAGRFLLRPLFRLIGHLGEREMFVFAALFTVAGAAAVMQLVGLSTALGAFVAGVMLADTPYRHELEADVEPFRSVLLGLFFLSVGMLLDLHAILQRPLFVIGIAAALIATKTAIVTGIGATARMGWRQALALGLLLSQGGEFGFVLFAQAQAGQLIAPEAASLFGAIITLSMATTPFLMGVTRRFRSAPAKADQQREGPRADGATALVVGYGRFGQTVAQLLIAQDIPVTLIDRDVEMIDVAGEFGAKVYYGDGTRLDLLRQAGAAEASLILFCLDDDQIDPALLVAVREAFPQATVFARVYDRRAVIKLAVAPLEYAVREVLESAVVMGRRALASVGVDGPDIDRAEDRYRRNDRERLRAQVATGDLRAARDVILRQAERDAAGVRA